MKSALGLMRGIKDNTDYDRSISLVCISSIHFIFKKAMKSRKQLCSGVQTTCVAGSSGPRRRGASLQLRATDAEMLTPVFGELQGRTACQDLNGAQHNAAKRIMSAKTPLTFPFSHNTVSIKQHSESCGRSRRPLSPSGCRIMRCSGKQGGVSVQVWTYNRCVDT